MKSNNSDTDVDKDTQPSEQPKLLSGWVPVVKIFTTKCRAVRLLWALFTVTMVVALVSSISLVVHRYLTYVTVVRLDQRSPQESVAPPSVTVCLAEHEVDILPAHSTVTSDVIGLNNTRGILTGISRGCDGTYSNRWNSSMDAVSALYAFGGHFHVVLRTDPAGCYIMKVLEQVPSPPNSVCTTFDLSPMHKDDGSFWKVLSITIELVDPDRQLIGRPLVIVHERNSFPLDNFGRYLYEYLEPGSMNNVFFGKIITKRLNTRKKPCRSQLVELLGYKYQYEQVTCQWLTVCQFYHSNCGCLCPLELVDRYATSQSPVPGLSAAGTNMSFLRPTCPVTCHYNYPIALVNASICPQSCRSTTYKKLNQVLDSLPNRGTVQLVLIQAEGLTEMTEEELYSLPKLFSEIGGLSSFCFGFSCIVFFELFELAFWLRCTYRSQFTTIRVNSVTELSGQFESATTAMEENREGEMQQSTVHNSSPTDTPNCHRKEKPPSSISLQFNQSRTGKHYDKPTVYKSKSKRLSKMVNPIHWFSNQTVVRNSRSHPMCSREDGIFPPKVQSSPPTSIGRHLSSPHRLIALNPIHSCRVDGTRLSEYPSAKDSPIAELQRQDYFDWSTPNDTLYKRARKLPPAVTTDTSDARLAVQFVLGTKMRRIPFRIVNPVYE